MRWGTLSFAAVLFVASAGATYGDAFWKGPGDYVIMCTLGSCMLWKGPFATRSECLRIAAEEQSWVESQPDYMGETHECRYFENQPANSLDVK